MKQIAQHWKSPWLRRSLAVVWFLGVGGIAFLWQLGDTGLFDETEPVFAETARQMLERNDWGTPYFNDHLRFDKPPLMYWLVAIGYQLLGVNEWAARLPSALAAIALLGLCFYSLQRFRQTPPLLSAGQLWVPGMVGAAIVAFNPLMLVWGRAGVADMLLVSTLSGALLAFFIGYSQPHCPANQRRWYAVFYSLLGFAVLAKGLVAIALPVVILPTFLFYCGNARQVWRELRPGRGIWLTLAIAAPWFGLMLITHGQLFIDKFFFYHHVERFTSVISRQKGPWYYYFVVVFLGFAPWSVFLPGAILRLRLWRRHLWQQRPRHEQLGLFAGFWLIGVFGFFSLAMTKLPSYVLPLVPPAAILVVLGWAELQTTPLRSGWQRLHLSLSSGFNVLIFLVLVGVFWALPAQLAQRPSEARFVPLLFAADLPFRGMALGAAIALSILVLWLWRKYLLLWVPNLSGMVALVAFILLPLLSIIDTERQRPLRQLAQTATANFQPGDEYVLMGHRKSSVVFYARQKVNFLRKPHHIERYVRTISSQSGALLIIGKADEIASLALPTDTYQALGEAGQYQLIRADRRSFQTRPVQVR